jgi:uncharacterized protein
MDVFQILEQVIRYTDLHGVQVFKIGFVGNGEPLLEYEALKGYVLYISEYLKSGKIAAYSITNGLLVNREMLEFFKTYNVNLGFSIDGIQPIHDYNRCKTHARIMEKIELFKEVYGTYPSMNCTVGKEVLEHADETIAFFEPFHNRITFSRMVGQYGIALEAFQAFLEKAEKRLNVRRGGYDCTMYGGLCGAGMNNFFFANGKVYVCGNCVDLPPLGDSDMPFEKMESAAFAFDRTRCYKETLCALDYTDCRQQESLSYSAK